ncbi:MAG: ATP-binding cassette domain-containing protein [Burkholderiaceae bacterium]|nr:ATP-binding cassette domain-containing protein [Burkholderiaceae bacterium]
MPSLAPVLQISDLHFAYPEAPLFRGLQATLPPGLALVCGDAGTGKTTLLRLWAGEWPVQSGRLQLCGVDLQADPQAYRAQVFWEDPRSAALDATTPRAWWAALSARHAAWSAPALQAHTLGFSLEPHLDKPLSALSTGTRRKVLMAGALASGAALTLIDEPSAGLDQPSLGYLQSALRALATETTRTVVIAHYEAWPGMPWTARLDLPA